MFPRYTKRPARYVGSENVVPIRFCKSPSTYNWPGGKNPCPYNGDFPESCPLTCVIAISTAMRAHPIVLMLNPESLFVKVPIRAQIYRCLTGLDIPGFLCRGVMSITRRPICPAFIRKFWQLQEKNRKYGVSEKEET